MRTRHQIVEVLIRNVITDQNADLAAAMNDFCESPLCRHALLKEYFFNPGSRRHSLRGGRELSCRHACDVSVTINDLEGIAWGTRRSC